MTTPTSDFGVGSAPGVVCRGYGTKGLGLKSGALQETERVCVSVHGHVSCVCEILNSKCRILCPPHIAAAALLPRAYTTGWCQTNSSE